MTRSEWRLLVLAVGATLLAVGLARGNRGAWLIGGLLLIWWAASGDRYDRRH